MLDRWLAVVSISLVFGCSNKDDDSGDVANTVAGCQQQFAASKGYGYQNDSNLVGTTSATSSSTDAGTPQAAPISPVAQAIADCRSGDTSVVDTSGGNGEAAGAPTAQPGTDCELSKLMSHDAAVCSARALGLPEGLGYTATISFNYKFLRIVWAVKNTVKDNAGAVTGTTFVLDAITGAILDQSTWNSIAST